MPKGLIGKYRFDAYPNLTRVNGWVQEFLSKSVEELNEAFARNRMGNVALLTKVDEEGQTCIVEIVISKDKDGKPEVSAAGYRPAPMFANVAALLEARRDVIETLEDIVEKPLGADAGFYDPGRRRDVNVREASFAQLYDIMVGEARRRGFSA
ncbi:hypothetical protein [Cupriavidus metallidurans]|uniref:hypothetical protein n=1 Tax=Cupriavidus metallidurans TaxID=119219 RepID=UPI001CCE080D|nr:hypothetical protein [Cupriavidus metallidurans]UBM12699.1 hypothetical protein LAI70_28205 [Cupriavidus metallidurans]